MIASTAALRAATIPLLVLPAAMVLSFAVHELGHVLVGAICGQRLVLFTAGPVTILRLRGRLRIGLNRRLAYWGGMALSSPTSWGGIERHRRDSAYVLAGGPLASLAFGAFTLTAAIVRGEGHARAIVQSPLSFSLLMLGAMSLSIGIVTVAPGLFTAEGRSDGARVRRALNPSAPWRVEAIVGPMMHLLRPSAWPAEIATMLAHALKTEPTVARALLLHRWALDTGREAEAIAFLNTARRIATESDERAACAVDAAVHVALWLRDVPGAMAILDDAGVTRDDPAALVAHAAIAYGAGRVDDAVRDVRALERAAWTSLSPGLLLSHSAALCRMTIATPSDRIGVLR